MKVRYATTDDLDIITTLEKRALPILEPYVAVAQDYYFDRAEGEILLVEKAETPVAMGRYTVMPDTTVWIETIRVDPDHQGEGIGTLIYTEIEKIARKLKAPKLAMYTEDFNDVSMALVKKMEFTPKGVYGCYKLELDPNKEYPKTSFVPVTDYNQIESIVDNTDWTEKISLNRTFYDINRPILEEFISRGDLYTDGTSLLLQGNRTRPEGEQSMGMYLGDVADCIDAGIQITADKDMDTLLGIYPKDRKDIEDLLIDRKFEDTYNLHVFEKPLE